MGGCIPSDAPTSHYLFYPTAPGTGKTVYGTGSPLSLLRGPVSHYQMGQWTPINRPTCPMIQWDRMNSGI